MHVDNQKKSAEATQKNSSSGHSSPEIKSASPKNVAGNHASNELMEDDSRLFLSTKVVMLGESGVGKSSILTRFAYGNFQAGSLPTISPHFVCKVQTIYKLGGQKVKFNIWDTAGQEKYRCLT